MKPDATGFADVRPDQPSSPLPRTVDSARECGGGVIALAVGFGGVVLGARLTRRVDRRSRADDLLARALSDAVAAISDVAAGTVPNAMGSYGSAVAGHRSTRSARGRASLAMLQDDATTATEDGVPAVTPSRLPAAVGAWTVSDQELHVCFLGRGV